jgi:hypothetical protein
MEASKIFGMNTAGKLTLESMGIPEGMSPVATHTHVKILLP